MPDVKVFLSSTFRDLKDHRAAAIKAIRKLRGFSVVCMEDFGSQNGHSKAVCLEELERCDVYVGIFAWYYGTIPAGDECSLTETEFRMAKARGMPRLHFVADKALPIHSDLIEKDAVREKREEFHKRISADRAWDSFVTPDQLATSVATALQKEFAATAESPPRPTGPLHQLPSDIPDFIGRIKELDTLIAALDREGSSATVVTAIRGMGGIGKTTLAVHAARRLVARYPDAQIVVNLQGYGDAEPLTPIEVMAKVVQAFEPSIKPVDDPGQMTVLYCSVLDGKRVLILLDNAPAKADLRALVPPPPCGLIVTAREPVRLDSVTSIALDFLSRAESVALLRSASGRADVTDADWDRIAGLCGDLPLALRVAGSFLAEAANWTAADYIDALTDERTRLDALKLEGMPDRDVGAVLGLSARRLVDDDPALAERWQTLTIFPADFDEPAAAAVWDADPAEARRMLTALLTRALLLFDADERRYRLLDLLRPIARQAFAFAGHPDPEPGSEVRLHMAIVRHAHHFKQVLAAANSLFLKDRGGVLVGLQQYDSEARNIAAAACWAMEHAHGDPEAANIIAWLPNGGADILDLRLNQRQRIVWLNAARHAARLINEPRLEGNHLGNLGTAYRQLGEIHRAIEHYEQSLIIDRKIGNRHGESADLGNLGIAYVTMGEIRRAIEYFEEALVIAREIGNRRSESSDLCNLGIAYRELGEIHRAIEYHEQALAISHEMGNRRSEANNICALGLAYAALGETGRAIKQYEQALVIRREIGDRHGEGIDLGNLSLAYATLGETRRAIDFGEQALATYEEIESLHAAKARDHLAKWRAALSGGA